MIQDVKDELRRVLTIRDMIFINEIDIGIASELRLFDKVSSSGRSASKSYLNYLTRRDYFYNESLHEGFTIYEDDFTELIIETYEQNKDWVKFVYMKYPDKIPHEIQVLLKLN